MNRDEKIKAIEDIKNGMPARFALNPEKYKILFRDWKRPGDCFFTADSHEMVTIEEREKYLPDSILFVSVAGMTQEQIKEIDETGIYPEYKEFINN